MKEDVPLWILGLDIRVINIIKGLKFAPLWLCFYFESVMCTFLFCFCFLIWAARWEWGWGAKPKNAESLLKIQFLYDSYQFFFSQLIGCDPRRKGQKCLDIIYKWKYMLIVFFLFLCVYDSGTTTTSTMALTQNMSLQWKIPGWKMYCHLSHMLSRFVEAHSCIMTADN